MELKSIDKNALLELKDLLEDEFQELIETYIADTNAKLDETRECLRTSNIDQTRRLAHSVKGASVNIGVVKLGELCSQIEQSAIENNISICRELFDSAIAELTIVQEELLTYV